MNRFAKVILSLGFLSGLDTCLNTFLLSSALLIYLVPVPMFMVRFRNSCVGEGIGAGDLGRTPSQERHGF